MNKFNRLFENIMSDAMVSAYEENMDDNKVAKKCNNCGFVIPKYQGAYPKSCSNCGDVIDDNDPEINLEEGIISNEIGKSLATPTQKNIQKKNGGEILRVIGNGKSAKAAPPKIPGQDLWSKDYDYTNPSKEIKLQKGKEYIVNKLPMPRKSSLFIFTHEGERVSILVRNKKDVKELPFRVKLMGLF